MFLPMAPLGVVFGDGLLQTLAAVFSAVGLWLRQRADQGPVEELTERFRHPVRWAVKHPIRAVGRRRRG